MNSPSDLPLTTHPHGTYFAGNRWHQPHSGETLDVIDPATGGPFATIARGDAHDIDVAVKAARSAFNGEWGATEPAERGRILMRIATALRDNATRLAHIESRDVGKPLKQSQADIAATARYFEFYAGAADKIGGDLLPFKATHTVMVMRVPFGVTGHIVPWNYPSQIFGRSVAASLAAGNACVVKPPEDACLALLEIAQLAVDCGLPAGALNIVPGLGPEAGAALAAHHDIDHISFTGSPETGANVAQTAAQHHCPVTLELGGKSPQIVFADADLDAAAPVLVNAIIQNSGQTCSAGSRYLIEESVYEPLLERLGERFTALRVGLPQANLDLGPVVNAKQHKRVANFLGMALVDQLRIVARGQRSDNLPQGGYYIEPHLVADVPHDHPLAQQEIFGPVAIAMPFRDEAHAVELANGTQYGLVAGVWTRDAGRGLRMARVLHSGQVFINDYGAGGGVELPFGGVKKSGHGREKGLAGMLSFTTLKTIAIKH